MNLVELYERELARTHGDLFLAVGDSRLGPCPHTGDRPGIHYGRRSGKLFLRPCTLGCPVCEKLKGLRFNTEIELVNKWNEESER